MAKALGKYNNIEKNSKREASQGLKDLRLNSM